MQEGILSLMQAEEVCAWRISGRPCGYQVWPPTTACPGELRELGEVCVAEPGARASTAPRGSGHDPEKLPEDFAWRSKIPVRQVVRSCPARAARILAKLMTSSHIRVKLSPTRER